MFYVTISGYDYIDQLNWGQGRYSQFPRGGSSCNIRVNGFELLQTSSPARYVKGNVSIELGKKLNHYWQPFPAMRCYPIVLNVDPPEQPFECKNFRLKILYRFVSN